MGMSEERALEENLGAFMQKAEGRKQKAESRRQKAGLEELRDVLFEIEMECRNKFYFCPR
jgi:hypothetical protein